MGGIDEEHTVESIKALEEALLKLNYKFRKGAGLEALKAALS
jgi:aspartate aminotransferase-like enzyme